VRLDAPPYSAAVSTPAPPREDPRNGRFLVPEHAAPDRLDRVLRTAQPGVSWGAVRDLVRRGKVRIDGVTVTDPGTLVHAGAEVAIDVGARRADVRRPVPALPDERIAHRDARVVVVDKPSGVDTVPFAGQTSEPALVERIGAALGAPVRVVHRLDRDTTGLIVFARTREAELHLAQQLRRHTVHRRYLAVAHGAVAPGTLRSFFGADRGDQRRGSIQNRKLGKEAITHVEVVERLRGATLVGCRLETGRTHQIRIHLAEAGHMLLGERAYTRDHRGATLPAPRILLHAAELGFVHPHEEAEMRFRVEMPGDMERVVRDLRG
jgi:23S rRNA pseudouridine1911/1915/1917 synthase